MERVKKRGFSGFDWREAKHQSNLQKHKVDFGEAAAALLLPHTEQKSERNGEMRIKAFCQGRGYILTVIFVMRDGVCNIISARPARRDERRAYHQIFSG